jgi:pimeloyl-ACP methyl ester carboxylesterase
MSYVELVHTFAADELRLDGALYVPAESPEPGGDVGLDAVLVLHGTGSNFYGSRFLAAIAERVNSWGAACLVANTRGHDQITTALVRHADGSTASRTIGSAYERVDECRLDVAAWVGLLAERGHGRIGVFGHSLGAVKTVYAAVHDALPGLAAAVAISPPRLSYSHFAASPRGPGFLEEVAAAEAHIAAGRPDELMSIRFPIPYVITAAGYLDKYGPAENYNLLGLVDRLPVPTLFTFGSSEVQQGIAFRGFPDALEEARAAGARLKTVVIAGGDHHYTGVQGDLLNAVERWLHRGGLQA